MEDDQEPDVRSQFAVTTSDRVFVVICVVVAIYMMVLLTGCAAIWSLTTHSDGDNIVGDFMIGEPHENQSFEAAGNRF